MSLSIQKATGVFHRLVAVLILLATAACNVLTPGTPTSTVPKESPPVSTTPSLAAELTFRVEIPANTPPEQPVSINILEEVNGLALNAKAYPMQAEDDRHYKITLPFALGSVVKYRYSRQGEAAPVEEHISDGRQVRYRLYHVINPATTEDVVSRWTDTAFDGSTGRISGKAADAATGQPLANILAAVGGVQALTSSDGTFLIEGLPAGIHNLVLYSLDGTYRTFQQGARISAGTTTPAQVRLQSAPPVSLVFVLSVPPGTIPAVPIRMAGNLYPLGNTFANLSGGVSTIAARMPTLNVLPDGRSTITLSLPAGADLHYLYTLGDGLWNTEKKPGSPYPIRQIIVPEGNTQVNDTVESWSYGQVAPITFDITVPADTPAEDTVSIQFNPIFGWTEPIPMWRLGNNHWAYVLNGPATSGEFRYRFCRNDQCGSADDAQTMGATNPGYAIQADAAAKTAKYTVKEWAWMEAKPDQGPVTAPPVAVRGLGFTAGVEMQPSYDPSWAAYTPEMLDDLQGIGANWNVLTPTWTFTRAAPPVLEQVPGQDALWNDLANLIGQTRQRGLNVALFPTPHFPGKAADWWASAPRDFPWWAEWFQRYRTFILHHADLAARSDAQALILGGDWLEPALPGGSLADGSQSGTPDDDEARWRALIQEVRAHFNGKLLWALPFSQAATPPAFLDAVDEVYLLFSEKLTTQAEPVQADLEAEAARLIDSDLLPLQARLSKPILLAAAYPSADGAGYACLPDPAGGCLDFSALARPNPDYPDIPLDLQEQADIYNALFVVVNQRTWITGFVSRGYYPPVTLRDKSTSIHGKPAADIAAFWFPRLLGTPAP